MEDILGLEDDIVRNGKSYHDVMRIFSGDTPARQLEAGQQCGGNYVHVIKSKNYVSPKSSRHILRCTTIPLMATIPVGRPNL